MASEIGLWMPRPRTVGVYDLTGKVIYEYQLDENTVVCDLCNANITIRPVPTIVEGHYAVCLECLKREVPDWWQKVKPWVINTWFEQLSQSG